MQRHRVLVAFGIAWLTALLLSWGVYRRSNAPESRQVIQAVAAARVVPVGTLLSAADLRLVQLDRKDLPQGAFFKTSDVVDRAASTPLTANELVLEGKLAAKGSGAGLPALIEPGLRAVSVQVNEVSGVAGFIQPGTHVDVLFTRTLANGDAATTTILQNVKVLAYGQRLESAARPEVRPAGRTDLRENTRPTPATLLVTQEQAEKLALAVQRGRIQLALRNPLDSEISERTEPVGSADLGITEPVRSLSRNGSALGAAPPETVRPPSGIRPPSSDPRSLLRNPAQDGRRLIRVYRGSQLSEESFE